MFGTNKEIFFSQPKLLRLAIITFILVILTNDLTAVLL